MSLRFSLLATVVLFGCTSKVGQGGDDTGINCGDADKDGVCVQNGDCDDSDPNVHGAYQDVKAATETCDGKDNDCNGEVDDNATDGVTWYKDADGDGYGDDTTADVSCEQPTGYVDQGGDCNDADTRYHPNADESDCTDANDYNCDGSTAYDDADGDGYAACKDCNDKDATIHPGADETCNLKDDNCNGTVDEDPTDGSTFYKDADSDGFGDVTQSVVSCEDPTGYVSDDTDCNDTKSTVNPKAPEVCDGLDNDCDGVTDPSTSVDATTWYRDADGDGYGDKAKSETACTQPVGYVADGTDCNDASSAVNPGATEICNGIDDDCDGVIDPSTSADAGTYYYDGDSDKYGDPSKSETQCTADAGYVTDNTDCNDSKSSINPAATEVCNSTDDDCNGLVDDNPSDGFWTYTDSDGDGFGAPGSGVFACSGISNDADCDDTDPNQPLIVDGKTGTDAGPGTSGSPYRTIGEGISAATGCVAVEAGTYDEAVDFGGSDIMVTGVDGADKTTIDATGTSTAAVSFTSGESSSARLKGFTITGGTGWKQETTESTSCSSGATCTTYYDTYCGGGVAVSGSSPTLEDLLVESNTLPAASSTTSGYDTYDVSSEGGGLCFLDSSSVVDNLTVTANYADQGGGIYADKSTVLDVSQSVITLNDASDGAGVAVDQGSLTMTNAITSWNTATGAGGGLYATNATVSETNVIHGGDSAATGGGVDLNGASTGTITNTIVYGATSGYGIVTDTTATLSGTYNNVYGNSPANYSPVDLTGTLGNISKNPLFTSVSADGDYTNDDWSLSSTSPSKDAGNPSSAYDDVDGSTNDQGAYGGPNGKW